MHFLIKIHFFHKCTNTHQGKLNGHRNTSFSHLHTRLNQIISIASFGSPFFTPMEKLRNEKLFILDSNTLKPKCKILANSQKKPRERNEYRRSILFFGNKPYLTISQVYKKPSLKLFMNSSSKRQLIRNHMQSQLMRWRNDCLFVWLLRFARVVDLWWTTHRWKLENEDLLLLILTYTIYLWSTLD